MVERLTHMLRARDASHVLRARDV